MHTTNDLLFCLLESCSDGLESSKLIYYMYVFQLAGFDFKFKYRLTTSGMTCKQLNNYLSEVVNLDKVEISNGVVTLTTLGRLYYDNVVLTASEWDKINYIKSVLDALNEEELLFVCITHIIVYDVLRDYGVDGLISQKEKIQQSLSVLSSEYSDDNFNTALKFIRKVKES